MTIDDTCPTAAATATADADADAVAATTATAAAAAAMDEGSITEVVADHPLGRFSLSPAPKTAAAATAVAAKAATAAASKAAAATAAASTTSKAKSLNEPTVKQLLAAARGQTDQRDRSSSSKRALDQSDDGANAKDKKKQKGVDKIQKGHVSRVVDAKSGKK